MSRSGKSANTSFPKLAEGEAVKVFMGMDVWAKANVVESHSHKCVVKLVRSGRVLTLTDANALAPKSFKS